MSTSQRLLLVIVLLLAGGAAAGALLLGEEEGRDSPTITGPAEVAPPPAAPHTDLDGPSLGARVSAEGDPTGELIVRVLNDRGAPITAEVSLTSPEGHEVQAQGSTTWSEFPIGDWDLRVRMEGLINYRESISVIADEVTLITAQLLPILEVRGKVVDRFGQSVVRANVWFMRRGQVHPADRADARKIQTAATDTRGMFRAELDKKGQIRMSVGKPGRSIIESEQITFTSAGPKEVTIVVSGTGRLEVEIQNPPPALAEGKANLYVTVLAKRDKRDDGPRKLPTPGARRKAGKEKAEQGSGLTRELRGGLGPRTATGDAASRKKAGGEAGVQKGTDKTSSAPELRSGPGQVQATEADSDWTPMGEAYLPPEGSLSFKALPPDRDLVLMVTRRGDRFRSRPFRLSSDRASLVRFLTPVRRSDGDQAAKAYGELEVQVQERPLPADAPQIGFTLE